MDDVDRAQEINEAHLADSLTAYQRAANLGLDRVSHRTCIDCDEVIPEGRRRAVPGCFRCIDCQNLHENWRPT